MLEAATLEALAHLLSEALPQALGIEKAALLLWNRKLDNFEALTPGETHLSALRPDSPAPIPESGFLLSEGTLLPTRGGRGDGVLVPLMPVSFWAIITGARARDPRRLFSGLGYFFLYLPWGISPRTLNYSHYLFEAIPYACLSLGTILDLNWDAAGWRRLAARSYLALVVAMYFFFLPFLLALPVPTSWYYFDKLWGWRPWTWFPSWV